MVGKHHATLYIKRLECVRNIGNVCDSGRNVCNSGGMSATVGEMSATVDEMSATVGKLDML